MPTRFSRTLLVLAFVAAGCASVPEPPGRDQLSASDIQALTRIAKDATQGVLARDLARLFHYALSDLRENRASLRAMQPELESYLFGDVYRVVTSASPLRIHVGSLGSDDAGVPSAQLVLYDASTITETMLRQADFLCEHDLKDAVAWTFRRVDGRWEAIGYPFDAFTDVHCPPD